jgi:hypothetical protein
MHTTLDIHLYLKISKDFVSQHTPFASIFTLFDFSHCTASLAGANPSLSGTQINPKKHISVSTGKRNASDVGISTCLKLYTTSHNAE